MENKRTKVIMLPTEDEVKFGDLCTSARYGDKPLLFGQFENSYPEECKKQYLYFTPYEKPKEVDWCIDTITKSIYQLHKFTANDLRKRSLKIISTTDSKLKLGTCEGCEQDKDYRHFFIKCTCSLPQPSQSFIEAFCKAGGIWKVLVEYKLKPIPEGVPMEYGTFLDANNPLNHCLKVNSHNEITIHPIKDSWNKEDVLQLCEKAWGQGRYNARAENSRTLNQTSFKTWIKENL